MYGAQTSPTILSHSISTIACTLCQSAVLNPFKIATVWTLAAASEALFQRSLGTSTLGMLLVLAPAERSGTPVLSPATNASISISCVSISDCFPLAPAQSFRFDKYHTLHEIGTLTTEENVIHRCHGISFRAGTAQVQLTTFFNRNSMQICPTFYSPISRVTHVIAPIVSWQYDLSVC